MVEKLDDFVRQLEAIDAQFTGQEGDNQTT